MDILLILPHKCGAHPGALRSGSGQDKRGRVERQGPAHLGGVGHRGDGGSSRCRTRHRKLESPQVVENWRYGRDLAPAPPGPPEGAQGRTPVRRTRARPSPRHGLAGNDLAGSAPPAAASGCTTDALRDREQRRTPRGRGYGPSAGAAHRHRGKLLAGSAPPAAASGCTTDAPRDREQRRTPRGRGCGPPGGAAHRHRGKLSRRHLVPVAVGPALAARDPQQTRCLFHPMQRVHAPKSSATGRHRHVRLSPGLAATNPGSAQERIASTVKPPAWDNPDPSVRWTQGLWGPHRARMMVPGCLHGAHRPVTRRPCPHAAPRGRPMRPLLGQVGPVPRPTLGVHSRRPSGKGFPLARMA